MINSVARPMGLLAGVDVAGADQKSMKWSKGLVSGLALVRRTAQWCRVSAVETSSKAQPRFARKKDAAAEEAGQCELRFLGVVLHHVSDTGLVQKLEATAGKPRFVERVDDGVAGLRIAVGKQPLAGKQCRDAVAEPDLDRADGGLPDHPGPKRRALGGADCDREQTVAGSVRAGHYRAFADEPVKHVAHTGAGPFQVGLAPCPHAVSLALWRIASHRNRKPGEARTLA